MRKVGITGQAGFMGTHLFNYLGLHKNEIKCIPFQDGYFNDKERLKDFVLNCDVIVHLAAMNRHGDPQVIYDTNIRLVQQLIAALEECKHRPHVLFSSSTQEDRDNPYGRSKKEGRALFEQWAAKNNARFTGLIIPNVFGPFGNPFYNSVIATFCHQLTRGQEPKIDVDGLLKLIYINELAEEFYRVIISEAENKGAVAARRVPHTAEKKVSEILRLLESYKSSYFEKHVFPRLRDPFEVALFNTFRCYMDIAQHYPVKLAQHADARGIFVETIKLEIGGQVSFSTTKPGITRGNHFHTRKIERFAVIKGEALIQLRRIGSREVLNFRLSGSEPAFVDMPVWYTHNIKNVGDDDLFTIFWINEFFDPNDPDTFFEVV